jgi:hypothetical protein
MITIFEMLSYNDERSELAKKRGPKLIAAGHGRFVKYNKLLTVFDRRGHWE